MNLETYLYILEKEIPPRMENISPRLEKQSDFEEVYYIRGKVSFNSKVRSYSCTLIL
jgi:hypothetical protein